MYYYYNYFLKKAKRLLWCTVIVLYAYISMNFSCTETSSPYKHKRRKSLNRILLNKNNKGTVHNKNNEPPAHRTKQQDTISATSNDNEKLCLNPKPNPMSNDAYSLEDTPSININIIDDKEHKEDEEISVEEQAKKLLLADGIKLNKEDIAKSELFYLAVSEGHVKAVELLLQDPEVKTKINEKHKNKYSLLHMAVDKNYTEIAKELIHAGVEVDAITDYKSGHRTALHMAAQNGNVEIIEELIKKDVDINKTTGCMYGNRTALHIAVDGNREQVVAKLLGNGAHVNVKAYFDVTPLHIAAQRSAAIKASIKKEGNLNVHITAQRSNLAIIRMLVGERS
ncbi:hypothetical protein CCPUN_02410 [Cardinium endosymbiont of Culicoides punctatus]|nr:hypothetical protein CCPUN_02410 [Cardinium endosymbiont of Culicoides punctatus]